MGPALADVLRTDTKPALMSAIDAELAANPYNPSHEPRRTCRAAGASKASSVAAGGKAKANGKKSKDSGE